MDNVDKSVDIPKTCVDEKGRSLPVCIKISRLYTWRKTWKNKNFLSDKRRCEQDFRKLSTNCQQLVDKIT